MDRLLVVAALVVVVLVVAVLVVAVLAALMLQCCGVFRNQDLLCL